MKTAQTALLVLLAVSAEGLAEQEDQSHAPTLTCFDPGGKLPPKLEVRKSGVTISRDGRRRAYTRMVETFDRRRGCRTKAQLFVSIGKSRYEPVYTEITSKADDPLVSLGPVAWSPNSRWLVVERAAEFYQSDFGGLNYFLYDSLTGKVSEPDVLGLIERHLGKHCALGYRSSLGFDAKNRLIVGVADWEDDNGRETYCFNGTAEWNYDPVKKGVSAGRASGLDHGR